MGFHLIWGGVSSLLLGCVYRNFQPQLRVVGPGDIQGFVKKSEWVCFAASIWRNHHLKDPPFQGVHGDTGLNMLGCLLAEGAVNTRELALAWQMQMVCAPRNPKFLFFLLLYP